MHSAHLQHNEMLFEDHYLFISLKGLRGINANQPARCPIPLPLLQSPQVKITLDFQWGHRIHQYDGWRYLEKTD